VKKFPIVTYATISLQLATNWLGYV